MGKKILGMGTAAMDTLMGIEKLPRSDAFELLRSEQLVPGGSCANMLVTYAALGGESKQLAKIGDDRFGQAFRETLEEDGVDVSLLKVKSGGTTLHTYVMAAENGEHCIFANIGDCLMQLEPEEITENMLDGIDLFYGDLFPCRAAIRMAELAKKKKIPVAICLQCPPDFMAGVGVSLADIEEILSYADLIISGRDGYFQLTKETETIAATQALYQIYQPRHGCVCTAGSEGAVWVTADQVLRAKAYAVQSIDSTGAGDAFFGGLLYSYFHQEESRQQALDFASALGAMKCTVWGPRIKTTPQKVREFIRLHAREESE